MSTLIVDHPLVARDLATLRDETTPPDRFRRALHDLSRAVIYEATRGLATTETEVQTPLARAGARLLEAQPILVPVLRAGLGMLAPGLELFPDARVGFVGLRRNEETLRPDTYLTSIPDDLGGRPVLVLDPMLATGGSLIATLRLFDDCNAGPLLVACVLAAPEGIEAVAAAGFDIELTTAAVDDHLNEIGYIVPGLGDAGDRQFGEL